MMPTPGEALPVPYNYLDGWRSLYTQTIANGLNWLRQDAALIEALTWQPVSGWPDGDKLMPSWELVLKNREALFTADASPDQALAILMQWRDGIKLTGGAAATWGGKDQLDLAKTHLKTIRSCCESILEQTGDFSEADDKAAELLPL